MLRMLCFALTAATPFYIFTIVSLGIKSIILRSTIVDIDLK
jgi:hypothetical protein